MRCGFNGLKLAEHKPAERNEPRATRAPLNVGCVRLVLTCLTLSFGYGRQRTKLHDMSKAALIVLRLISARTLGMRDVFDGLSSSLKTGRPVWSTGMQSSTMTTRLRGRNKNTRVGQSELQAASVGEFGAFL